MSGSQLLAMRARRSHENTPFDRLPAARRPTPATPHRVATRVADRRRSDPHGLDHEKKGASPHRPAHPSQTV
jgi:hypothetical protein